MPSASGPFNLASTFLRLRSDASAEPLPVDDTFWQRLAAGRLGDFQGECLVAIHAFDTDWPTWEMHPNGDEIVCLLSGSVVFVVETADGIRRAELREPGDCHIVPRGAWHTAQAAAPCRVLFITPGQGTQHRAAAG